MAARLSQKVIGRRITEIRKLKGLSQADLAKRIKISRPSLAQIELCNRSVDAPFSVRNYEEETGEQ